MPFLVIAGLLVVMLLGVWLFPRFKTRMTYEDCVASGRVDCSR